MTTLRPGVPTRKNTVLYLSPWLMVGFAVILGLAVAVLAIRNTQREKHQMSQNLMDRAEALIWALEAGTRTWVDIRGGSDHLQSLLEETAKQPGITYMAVTDAEGLTLAHSDKAQIGTKMHDSATMAGLNESDVQKWRITNTPRAGKVFEVYKHFSPQPGILHDKWHSPSDACPDCKPDIAAQLNPDEDKWLQKSGPVIFVGLNVKPFEEALAEDFRNTVVIALLVLLLGFGGFVSMFWAQNYRLSRRLLQDTQAFASEVVTNLPVGLLTSDTNGLVTLVNCPVASMLGMDREELMGSPIYDKGGLDWNTVVETLSRDRAVLEQERNLVASGGKVTPISLSASRIINEDGLFLGHLFIMRDLGEVKNLQDQVRRNERLTALGNLAAGVAHEIRNPLSSIKGFATFLAGKIKGEGADKDAAKMMIQEVDRLNRVVSELLEFARPGELRLRNENINDIIERALRLADCDVSAKKITVHFPRNDLIPLVLVDAERLTQALLNLFLNAIQSTEKGGELQVFASIDRESGRLGIRISDTGKGISPEVLAGIFNPYFTTKPSGTGLGLAIVHRIVEGHGGEIKVESQPHKGSVFTILLPLVRAA